MRGSSIAAASWLACSACSGSAPGPEAGNASSNAGASDSAACATTSEVLPLAPGAAPTVPAAEASPYVTFIDCTTGFRTDAVHDADREVVHFDAPREAMVSAASGDSVGGWTVAGADLDWSRSGVSFRVRFGTEAGERRAYFTEAGPGTICNLNLAGPDVLFISGTGETPPNP
jgi:hypothetical protein